MNRDDVLFMITMFTILALMVGVPGTFAFLHINAWEQQDEKFHRAHDEGRHADAVAIFEEKVDVPWTPMNLRLANKRASDYALAAGDSYEQLGMQEQAQAQYLRLIGWSTHQYAAYCALVDGCDARNLALIHTAPPTANQTGGKHDKNRNH